MNTSVESILYSVIASIICDIGKYVLGRLKSKKMKFNENDVKSYVLNKIDDKYKPLCDSGVLIEFIKNPLILDTITNYTIYVITGKFEKNLLDNGVQKKGRNRFLQEKEIIDFLVNNLENRYQENNTFIIPEHSLMEAFFADIFLLGSEYILEQMSQEDIAVMYFVNSKMNMLSDGVFSKLDEIVASLNKSIRSDVVYSSEKLAADKEYYTKILKDNHKMAHIYLLDKFEINKFYVPPFLAQRVEKNGGFYYKYNSGNKVYKLGYTKINDVAFDDWKYIFERSNIVYVIGGAGYGKSLFMNKVIGEYERLNLINANEYMVIYGELKNFFVNNEIMSVIDFLQYSMKKETLIEESILSQDLINYYLKRGRCIILLDALDEVDREKRQKLHSSVVNFFRNQNPNNKVCITSRARGFLPEKDVEVFEIAPLDAIQIEKYVDNIINLGKFDKQDKEAFLHQTKILVEKGFLNSFLVLSLLINIYKAERELPENKLELYQKCFEYISNRREKEKSQDKYNWTLITTLMKDNTFMELANLCLPNNSDVRKEVIKETLTPIYRTKYVSENEAELAIDQFLVFCSDRTELFVPASGEDCFKFFHRSFFEYFYSQYIFTRMNTVEEIYYAWNKFDVDSEIFELSLAMFKQKYESKYQEIVEYLLKKMNDFSIDKRERINSMNMFVLCTQVIDDEFYKKQFVNFLISESKFCKRNIDGIHNQGFIVNVISSRKDYIDLICQEYQDIAEYEAIVAFSKAYPDMEYILKQDRKNEKLNNETDIMGFRFRHFYNYYFYTQVFFKNNSIKSFFSNLTTSYIAELGRKNGVKTKEINKIQSKYKKFMALNPDLKERIEKAMFGSE